MQDPDEIRGCYVATTARMRMFLDELARHPGVRRTNPQIESALGWVALSVRGTVSSSTAGLDKSSSGTEFRTTGPKAPARTAADSRAGWTSYRRASFAAKAASSERAGPAGVHRLRTRTQVPGAAPACRVAFRRDDATWTDVLASRVTRLVSMR